jgi:hypothetical protein
MPTHYFSDVARADHEHFDPGPVGTSEFAPQRPNIELLILGRVKECQRSAVKAVLGFDKLGVLDSQLAGLLTTINQGIEFFLLPKLAHHQVPWRCLPLDLLYTTPPI